MYIVNFFSSILPVVFLSLLPLDLFGMSDRGRVRAGLRADLNLIDLDAIRLGTPRVEHDLPTGAPRLLQDAQGYVATLVAGQVVQRDGVDTGARPGGLVRG